MRKRAERQLPLDFAGTQKLTQDWYSLYKDIHEILDQNPAITDLVHFDLTRGTQKLKRNVEGVASESILRLALVQQIEKLSFRETIVRVDDSQMLRFFCRFYDDPILSHGKYADLVNLIQPETWKKINEVIVRFARDKKGFKGKKLRIDTTAVESDIHFPMDSSLLMDCVRVVSRLVRKAQKIDADLVGKWRARVANAKRLTQKLLRGGKRMHTATREKLYRHLIKATERTMDKAREVRARIEKGEGRIAGIDQFWELQSLSLEIAHYLALAEKCVYQARERVLNGQVVPHEKKLFSIFEPHTELLIRGKAGKEIEFGHMIEIHQIEGGLITAYATHAKRPAEPPLLEKAVAIHALLFGQMPEVSAGDKGFYSKSVVENVEGMGVEKVCVPKKGRRNARKKSGKRASGSKRRKRSVPG